MLILAAEKDQEALQISEALDQHLSYENWIKKKKGRKDYLFCLFMSTSEVQYYRINACVNIT
jgi:hypothetical protein